MATLEELAKEHTQEVQESTADPQQIIDELKASILQAAKRFPSLFSESLVASILETANGEATQELAELLTWGISSVLETTETLLNIYRRLVHEPLYSELKASVFEFAAKIDSPRYKARAKRFAEKHSVDVQNVFPEFLEIDEETDRTGTDILQLIYPFTEQTIYDYQQRNILPPDADPDEIFAEMLQNPEKEPFSSMIELIKEWATDFLTTAATMQAIQELGLEEEPQAESKELLPHIKIKPTRKADFPLDKVNASVWKLLKYADKNGQIMLNLDTGRRKKDGAIVTYSVNFGGLPADTAKRLTGYDKLVQSSVGAVFNAGNKYMTLSDIYRHMGYKGNPGKADFERINNSLTKLGSGRAFIDTRAEKTAGYKYKNTQLIYDDNFISFQRVNGYKNGAFVNAAIYVDREPILLKFARDREQITTIPIALLEYPLNKSEQNINIADYLIERIAHMKNNPKLSRKILFSTLCERCNVTRNKTRAIEAAKTILEHFKKECWIVDFAADKNGATIML